jgi:alpha-1,3-fucosyltransferase
MTYRRDSDIIRPYGFIVPKKDCLNQRSIPRGDLWEFEYSEKEFVENALPKKSSDFLELAKRPKKIAWVVSNCNARSRREAYVEELQKYIDVDIFGKCGTITCDVEGARAQAGNCATAVADEYKFYLSFESTFAKDYVTEKFFMRMNMNLVPIVLGQGDYNRTAPPRSFISVLDYESPKALADYIRRLDSNDTEYLSYFWWKDYYHVESQTMMQLAFCDLCAKLHEAGNSKVKPYQNFGKWWHEGANIDEKLPRMLSMIDEEMPSESGVAQQTPRLRMSFEK